MGEHTNGTHQTMANPELVRVNPEGNTLNTETKVNDGATTVAFKLAGTATDLVEARTVKINGQIGPTAAARFYGMVGSAMYEAQQIYNRDELTSLGNKKSDKRLAKLAKDSLKNISKKNRESFVDNVIAYASTDVMRREAPEGASIAEAGLIASLNDLGRSADAAAKKVGKAVADAVLSFYELDGSRAASGYSPINSGPTDVRQLDRWTPEYNVGGNLNSGTQNFLTPQWGEVKQVLSKQQLRNLKAELKSPEPFLLDPEATHDAKAGTITRANGEVVAISKALIGIDINPAFIEQAQRVIDASANLTDKQKLIAEFWEDGPGTGFPPGTWVEFGRYASELYDNTRQEDVRMFFGIGQALLSASVSSWGLKTATDYARPLTTIRELSRLELLNDVDPIIGGIQINAYNRGTKNTQKINGVDWETYQTFGNFYSPPFAEFTSGHSTFSSAAGKLIELITGKVDFGASITTTSLIEKEKNIPVTLSWDTWKDAWVESGNSRIFGGIHFDDGNKEGVKNGERIGEAVFAELSKLWA
jgi:hypothetical protein